MLGSSTMSWRRSLVPSMEDQWARSVGSSWSEKPPTGFHRSFSKVASFTRIGTSRPYTYTYTCTIRHCKISGFPALILVVPVVGPLTSWSPPTAQSTLPAAETLLNSRPWYSSSLQLPSSLVDRGAKMSETNPRTFTPQTLVC